MFYNPKAKALPRFISGNGPCHPGEQGHDPDDTPEIIGHLSKCENPR
jgi:hypothetical protein